MTNEEVQKIFSVIFSRATDQLKLFVGEIIDDSIYKRVFDTLFDILEPAYKRGLIKNYKIKCTKELNPDIYETLELIAQFSIYIEDYGWVDLEYHIGPNFGINVVLKYQVPNEWIPITFCTVDKNGNVKPLESEENKS